MSDTGDTTDTGDVNVWQAPRQLRIFSYAAIALVVLLAVRVLFSFGYLALIGVVLVLAAASQVWWMVLRPRLVAGPSGVDVVVTRQPEHIDWRDIRRAVASKDGIRIYCSNGREVNARFPQLAKNTPPGEEGEADRVASYLGQRAAWERRPSGHRPIYQPPQRPTTAA